MVEITRLDNQQLQRIEKGMDRIALELRAHNGIMERLIEVLEKDLKPTIVNVITTEETDGSP